MNKENFIHNF